MKTRLLALAALLVPAVAPAQTLPSRSIELYCAKRASAAGAVMNDLFGACVEAERASLGELKANWTDYSMSSRMRCISTTDPAGLYTDLEACIEAAEAMRAEGK